MESRPTFESVAVSYGPSSRIVNLAHRGERPISLDVRCSPFIGIGIGKNNRALGRPAGDTLATSSCIAEHFVFFLLLL